MLVSDGDGGSSSLSSQGSKSSIISRNPFSRNHSKLERTISTGGIYSDVNLWAEAELPCPVWCLSVSKSGVLCGCDNGTVVFMNSNLVTNETIPAHRSAVTHVQWTIDGLHFLSAGTDSIICIWSMVYTPEKPAEVRCLLAIPQTSPLVSACFHPLTFSSPNSSFTFPSMTKSSAPVSMAMGAMIPSMTYSIKAPNTQKSVVVFSLTSDRRIGVWVDGQADRYESLSSKDPPVCMASCLRGTSTTSLAAVDPGAAYLAVGTKTGNLLLYSYSPEQGLKYEASLTCRNRRGAFKEGTPLVSISWVNPNEMLVTTQDNRIRLVKLSLVSGMKSFGRISLSVAKKFRGHKSSGGEVPLGAFVLTPPFGDQVVQCGSECGRVFVWPYPGMKNFSEPRRSFWKRVARTLKPSRAIKSTECWRAVEHPDKLTAVAPAPWNPERGSIGGSCTVTGSLNGFVRMFFNRERAGSGRRSPEIFNPT